MSRLRPVVAVLCLSTVLAAGARLVAQERVPMSSHTVSGTFTVTMRPTAETRGPGEFVQLRLDKQFQGPLEGTSTVEMLASNAGDQSSGGYVALERFTGTLEGRPGGFVMQHSGTMTPKGAHIDVLVTPGSGTGDLAGIEGRLTIRIEAKQHYYELEYHLAQ